MMPKTILIFLLLLACSACSRPNLSAPSRKTASDEGEEKKWGFLVLSDIHLYTSTKNGSRKMIPPNFQNLLDKLETHVDENNIKFIVLLGDSTSGNQEDKFSLTSVKSWWDTLHAAFHPLMQKGIQIYPVAGNHDYYTKNHQTGYKYAWCMFVKEAKDCDDPQLHYVVNHRNLDLFLLHAVDYGLGKGQEEWLRVKSTELKDNGHVKIALGHVALYTRLISKPYAKFGDGVRGILEQGNIRHYLAGHEHYFWDEFIGGNKFRQTIVGTSSGTYNYAPHMNYYGKACKKLNQDGQRICELEPEQLKILARRGDRMQIHKQMFLQIEVEEENNLYQVKPFAFSAGEIVPFNF